MPYEYKCLVSGAMPGATAPVFFTGSDAGSEEWLNEMSLRGWDLVTMRGVDDNPTDRIDGSFEYIFRRRLDT